MSGAGPDGNNADHSGIFLGVLANGAIGARRESRVRCQRRSPGNRFRCASQPNAYMVGGAFAWHRKVFRTEPASMPRTHRHGRKCPGRAMLSMIRRCRRSLNSFTKKVRRYEEDQCRSGRPPVAARAAARTSVRVGQGHWTFAPSCLRGEKSCLGARRSAARQVHTMTGRCRPDSPRPAPAYSACPAMTRLSVWTGHDL